MVKFTRLIEYWKTISFMGTRGVGWHGQGQLLVIHIIASRHLPEIKCYIETLRVTTGNQNSVSKSFFCGKKLNYWSVLYIG